MTKIAAQLLLTLLSSILFALAQPRVDAGWLAWIFILPLLFALRSGSPKRGLFLGWFFGIAATLFSAHWLRYFSPIALVLMSLYVSLFSALFGWGTAKVYQSRSAGKLPFAPLFLIPALWVIYEYLRSTVFAGFGWMILGYTQYQWLSLIQIADVTGAYGISYVMILTSAGLLEFLVTVQPPGCRPEDAFQAKTKDLANPRSFGRFLGRWPQDDRVRERLQFLFTIRQQGGFESRTLLFLILPLAILGATLLYGSLRIRHFEQPTTYLNISAVQGNIPQAIKWDEKYREEILKQYEKLTLEAAQNEPDLIVWPETSLPGYLEDKEILARVKMLAKKIASPILFGSPRREAAADAGTRYFNSAVLLNREGGQDEKHDKLNLVPLTELLPGNFNIYLIRDIVPRDLPPQTPGERLTIFHIQEVPFGVTVCFESAIPNLTRRFIRGGAKFMVNLNNNAFFGNSGAPYMHTQATVFRAVENKIPYVQVSNTGVSAFISSVGRIGAKVKDLSGRDIFIEGHRTSRVGISDGNPTFYTHFGDVFAWLCSVITIAWLLSHRRSAPALPRAN